MNPDILNLHTLTDNETTDQRQKSMHSRIRHFEQVTSSGLHGHGE